MLKNKNLKYAFIAMVSFCYAGCAIYGAEQTPFIQLIDAHDRAVFEQIYNSHQAAIKETKALLYEDFTHRMNNKIVYYEEDPCFSRREDVRKKFITETKEHLALQQHHLNNSSLCAGLHNFVCYLKPEYYLEDEYWHECSSKIPRAAYLSSAWEYHIAKGYQTMWQKSRFLRHAIAHGFLQEQDPVQQKVILIKAHIASLPPIIRKVCQKCAVYFNNRSYDHEPIPHPILEAWKSSSASDFQLTPEERRFLVSICSSNCTISPIQEASVAKVVQVIVPTTNKCYAIKYLKERISQASIQQEKNTLFTWGSMAEQEINALAQKVMAEINFNQERTHLREGAKIYQGVNGIDTVSLADLDAMLSAEQQARCLVMPYVKGKTLKQALEDIKSGKRPQEHLTCMKHQLENLILLWKHNFYFGKNAWFHADLNPGNILVDDTGKLTLIDFGYMINHTTPVEKHIDNNLFEVHDVVHTTIQTIFKNLQDIINKNEAWSLQCNKEMVKTILPLLELNQPDNINGKEYHTIDEVCNKAEIYPYGLYLFMRLSFPSNLRNNKEHLFDALLCEFSRGVLNVHGDFLLALEAMHLVDAISTSFNNAVKACHNDLIGNRSDVKELLIQPPTWAAIQHPVYHSYAPCAYTIPSPSPSDIPNQQVDPSDVPHKPQKSHHVLVIIVCGGGIALGSYAWYMLKSKNMKKGLKAKRNTNSLRYI